MFKRVFKEALKWNAKWYLGSITSTVGIFMLMHNYYQYEMLRSVKYGATILILSILIKVIHQYILELDMLEKKLEEQQISFESLENSQNKRDLVRKHNYYGEVLLSMKEIFAQINKIKRTQNPSEKEIKDQLIRTANRVKSILEKRLNFTYSVSIKVIEISTNNSINETSEIVTIVRDEESYFKRKDLKNNGHKHTIGENTCFSEILKNIDSPSKSFFFSNDLCCHNGYCNSSFKDYGHPPKDIDSKLKYETWTLPYKSEIVVPISPLLYNSPDRKQNFFGYLAVDCDEIDAFHKKYDAENLLGVADGIYDLLEKWYLIKIKNNEQSN